jgi:hypothetical protein
LRNKKKEILDSRLLTNIGGIRQHCIRKKIGNQIHIEEDLNLGGQGVHSHPSVPSFFYQLNRKVCPSKKSNGKNSKCSQN